MTDSHGSVLRRPLGTKKRIFVWSVMEPSTSLLYMNEWSIGGCHVWMSGVHCITLRFKVILHGKIYSGHFNARYMRATGEWVNMLFFPTLYWTCLSRDHPGILRQRMQLVQAFKIHGIQWTIRESASEFPRAWLNPDRKCLGCIFLVMRLLSM